MPAVEVAAAAVPAVAAAAEVLAVAEVAVPAVAVAAAAEVLAEVARGAAALESAAVAVARAVVREGHPPRLRVGPARRLHQLARR